MYLHCEAIFLKYLGILFIVFFFNFIYRLFLFVNVSPFYVMHIDMQRCFLGVAVYSCPPI
jgi:hypothetical protein